MFDPRKSDQQDEDTRRYGLKSICEKRRYESLVYFAIHRQVKRHENESDKIKFYNNLFMKLLLRTTPSLLCWIRKTQRA